MERTLHEKDFFVARLIWSGTSSLYSIVIGTAITSLTLKITVIKWKE